MGFWALHNIYAKCTSPIMRRLKFKRGFIMNKFRRFLNKTLDRISYEITLLNYELMDIEYTKTIENKLCIKELSYIVLSYVKDFIS